MLRKIICTGLIIFFIFSGLISEQLQKTIVIPEIGYQTIFQEGISVKLSQIEEIKRNERVEILWQDSDDAAIAGEMKVSSLEIQTFLGWNLNYERTSLYLNNSTPMWEDNNWTPENDFCTDMLEDGSLMVAGTGNTLKVYSNDSVILWEFIFGVGDRIVDLALHPNGNLIYTAVYNQNLSTSYIEAYTIGNQEPIWQTIFPGNSQCLVLSGDGSTLVFTQYGGEVSAMWVLAAADGSIIFEAPEQNQNPPAICYDASIIVNGDYSGDVFVYEYVPEQETYQLDWGYQVSSGGGGYNPWITSMAISDDGSTIAVGTHIFYAEDFSGEIYLFNSYSSNPLWIFDANASVNDLDISADGSTIAAASWGPLNNSTPDFWIFGRNSNEPEFSINTPGSMFHLDLSSDGNLCSVGGKAVHAYEFGNGGYLYCVECDLGGGNIEGIVNLVGNEDNSGVLVEILELENYTAFTDVDGNYSLVFIPSGMYTVQASRNWYETVTEEFVLVFDDEITEVDFTMNELLLPPENVEATIVGAGTTALINWDEPDGNSAIRDLENYNVWRLLEGEEENPENWIFLTNIEQTFYLDANWEDLPAGIYKYAVNAVYLSGESDIVFSNALEKPVSIDDNILEYSTIRLLGCFPNPFSNSTTIKFTTEDTDKNTELIIFNIKGQKIKTFQNLQINKSPNQQILWNAGDQPSGIYFVILKTENFEDIRKLLLIR